MVGRIFRVPVEDLTVLIDMPGDEADAEIFRSLSDCSGHHLADAKVGRGRRGKRRAGKQQNKHGGSKKIIQSQAPLCRPRRRRI